MMAEGKIFDVAVKKTSHSIHLPKQSAIEIQAIKIIKKNETRRKEHSV
jgi:hypothetical protein